VWGWCQTPTRGCAARLATFVAALVERGRRGSEDGEERRREETIGESTRGEERTRPLTSMCGSCERGRRGWGLIDRAGAVGGGVCGARRGGWGEMANWERWPEVGWAGGWWLMCEARALTDIATDSLNTTYSPKDRLDPKNLTRLSRSSPPTTSTTPTTPTSPAIGCSQLTTQR